MREWKTLAEIVRDLVRRAGQAQDEEEDMRRIPVVHRDRPQGR